MTVIGTKRADGGTGNVVLMTLGVADHQHDLVYPGTLQPPRQRAIVSTWGHGSVRHGDPPVGTADVWEQDGRIVAAVTWDDTPAARGACKLVETAAPSWSIGYRASWRPPTDTERHAHPGLERVFTSLTVTEISPVANPAGVGTATIECACKAARCSCHGPSPVELRTLVAEAKATLKRARRALDQPNVADQYYVPAIDLPDELTSAAAFFARRAAGTLGLEPPTIIYYWPKDDAPLAYASKSTHTIALNLGWLTDNLRTLPWLVAHETRHLSGHNNHATKAADEGDADAFADRFCDEWHQQSGYDGRVAP